MRYCEESMVKHIGLDVVPIDRFRAKVDDKAFLRQVFSENEILKAPAGKRKAFYYALLFAVKESMLKAIGCGLNPGSYWHDMEVTSMNTITVTGVLRQMMDGIDVSRIHLSSSHSDRYAVACVVLE